MISFNILVTATSIFLTADVKTADFWYSFPSLSFPLKIPSSYWSLSTPTTQCLISPLLDISIIPRSLASAITPLPVLPAATKITSAPESYIVAANVFPLFVSENVPL